MYSYISVLGIYFLFQHEIIFFLKNEVLPILTRNLFLSSICSFFNDWIFIQDQNNMSNRVKIGETATYCADLVSLKLIT